MKSEIDMALVGVAMTIAWLCVPSQADASSLLPAATWTGCVSAGPACTNVTGPGMTTQTSPDAIAQVQGAQIPNPSVKASAAVSSPNGAASAAVQLDYLIEITGPGSGSVLLDVVANGSLFSTNFSGALEFLSVNSTTIGNLAFENGVLLSPSVGVSPGFNPASFTLTASLPVGINQAISVEMSAQAGGVGASATAFIDPYFFIDPSVANADQYSILTSAGIGNSPSATPLPSTWTMMLLGLGLFGFAIYGRPIKGSPTFAGA